MINIRFGKYKIMSDKWQYIMQEMQIVQEGKTAGKEVVTRTTYHNDIVGLLNSIWGRKVRESNAESFEELLGYMETFKNEILNVLPDDIKKEGPYS